MARPGTSLTGLTSLAGYETHTKRLDWFKRVVPTLRRVAVVYNGQSFAGVCPSCVIFKILKKFASQQGLELRGVPVKSDAELQEAMSSLSPEDTDGVFEICSALYRGVAATASRIGIPVMGCYGTKGPLLSYDTSPYYVAHRGGWYLAQILKGVNPAELPVEVPMHYELMINLKTAGRLGLTVPPETLRLADKVIR